MTAFIQVVQTHLLCFILEHIPPATLQSSPCVEILLEGSEFDGNRLLLHSFWIQNLDYQSDCFLRNHKTPLNSLLRHYFGDLKRVESLCGTWFFFKATPLELSLQTTGNQFKAAIEP